MVYVPCAGPVVFPWCPTESFGLLPQAGAGSCDHCYFFFLREWRQVDETVHTHSRTHFTFRTPGTPTDRSESGRCCTEKPASFTCSLCWVRLGCSLLYIAHLLFLFHTIYFCFNYRDWCIRLVTERVEVPFSIVSFPLSLLSLFSPFPLCSPALFPLEFPLVIRVNPQRTPEFPSFQCSMMVLSLISVNWIKILTRKTVVLCYFTFLPDSF